jgi:hypothetical protein
MEPSPPVQPATSSDRFYEAARAYFEPQLARLNLSEEQIDQQTLDQLGDSLNKINELISHPDSLGSFRLSIPAAKFWVVSTAEGHAEVGALPMLLERKSQILRRISTLRQELGLAELKDVVTTAVDSPTDQAALWSKIEERIQRPYLTPACLGRESRGD